MFFELSHTFEEVLTRNLKLWDKSDNGSFFIDSKSGSTKSEISIITAINTNDSYTVFPRNLAHHGSNSLSIDKSRCLKTNSETQFCISIDGFDTCYCITHWSSVLIERILKCFRSSNSPVTTHNSRSEKSYPILQLSHKMKFISEKHPSPRTKARTSFSYESFQISFIYLRKVYKSHVSSFLHSFPTS